MLFRDVIFYIGKSDIDIDEIGIPTNTPNKIKAFANKKSIRQSEFYQGQGVGWKPELMFEVRTETYKGYEKLTYKDINYNIIRTYTKNGEITELICSQHARGEE
jgi:hypothetical protein